MNTNANDTLANELGDGVRQIAISEFAPKRNRRDRQVATQERTAPQEPAQPQQQLIPPPAPRTDDIAEGATKYFTMVANLQDEHNAATKENAELRARVEQYKETVHDLRTQIELRTLDISAANQRTEDARMAVTRLKSILENIGGLIADGLQS